MAHALYIKTEKGRGKKLGTITDEQLQTLIDLLEEEGVEDQDYYIDRDVLEYLAEQECDPALLEMIRPHVGETEGVEIEWTDE
jgi:hypothetical protein